MEALRVVVVQETTTARRRCPNERTGERRDDRHVLRRPFPSDRQSSPRLVTQTSLNTSTFFVIHSRRFPSCQFPVRAKRWRRWCQQLARPLGPSERGRRGRGARDGDDTLSQGRGRGSSRRAMVRGRVSGFQWSVYAVLLLGEKMRAPGELTSVVGPRFFVYFSTAGDHLSSRIKYTRLCLTTLFSKPSRMFSKGLFRLPGACECIYVSLSD